MMHVALTEMKITLRTFSDEPWCISSGFIRQIGKASR